MENRVYNKMVAVFLALFLTLGLFASIPPVEASAASQYITNITKTNITGDSARVSFYYGKDASGDDTQTLYIILYDENKVEVQFKILRIVGFVDDNVNLQGNYSHTFTGLTPGTQYYVRINGNATAYSVFGNTNRHYWSEYVPVTTVTPSAPVIDLAVSDISPTSFRVRGSISSTGTGLAVDPSGTVNYDDDRTVFTRYSISVKRGMTTIMQTGEQTFIPGYTVFSYPEQVSGLSPNTSYEVTLTLTNKYGYTGSVTKTVSTLSKPTATFLDGEINLPYTPTLYNIYFSCEINADANDEIHSITAVRYGAGGVEIFGRVVKPYNAADKTVLFCFDGLAPATDYAIKINALCQSGYYGNIGAKTFTTGPAPAAATVSTNPAEHIKADGAKLTGEITADGNCNIGEHGFVYSLYSTGHTSDTLIIGGSGVTQVKVPLATQLLPIEFAAFLQGLTPGTGYDFRAYVRNVAGYRYGEMKTFATLTVPAVTTGASSDIGTTAVTLAGNVISTGGVSPTIRGFVLGQNTNPALGGENVLFTIDEDSSAGTGAYSTEASGLLPDTTYYYRAYIRNVKGTFYGTENSVKTEAYAGIPTVKLGLVSPPQINPGEKQVNATFTAPAGVTVIATGFVYSLTENPVIGGTGVVNHELTDVDGSFAATLTGLSASTTYYYKAYATDGTVTGYSSQGLFTTIAQITTGYSVPVVTRTETTAVTAVTATVETEANVSGSAHPLFYRRLSYSATNNDPRPGGAGVTTVLATFTGMTGDGLTTTTLTGLVPDTTYYLRCVTSNDQGYDYGSVVVFMTDEAGLPVVENAATPFNQVTQSGVRVYADINPNGYAVTAYGVLYSVSDEIPILGAASSLTRTGSGTISQNGSVFFDLAGLSGSTTYNYRIYAGNSLGISYGEVKSFTTLTPVAPEIAPPTNITPYVNGAVMDVPVVSDGTDWGMLSKIGIIVGPVTNPEITDLDVVILNGDYVVSEAISFAVSGLAADTVYYARPYGIALDGSVYYGSAVTFTTLDLPEQTTPVVTAESFLPVSPDSATLFGQVKHDGGSDISGRGFVLGTAAAPAIGGNGVTQVSDSGAGLGAFSAEFADLEQDVVYYVRAYATNEHGTSYSEDMLMILMSETEDPSDSEDEEQEEIPDTGNISRAPANIGLGLIAAGVLGGCLLMLRRRRLHQG